MSRRTHRRRFLQTSAAIGAGYWALGGIAPRESRAANEKIQFACVGVTGKGTEDSNDSGKAGDVIAICDVDDDRRKSATARFPNAEQFFDYREMFAKLGDKIDAFTVSTPDHCHALIAAHGMRMGKHAFVQKPLTHTLYEARYLGKLAAEKKLATQMGNQYTASSNLRRAAAIIKNGHIGTVKEVHVWTNRPVWDNQGTARPTEIVEVPASLHWKEWIGPAPMRPYHPSYHPFKWRGVWDFGTGALGDMACHTLNMPYHALDLRDPISVQATTSGHNKETYPAWSIINCQFGERNGRAPLTFMWYDGGKRPETPAYQKAEEIALSRNDEKKAKNLKGTLRSGCFVLGDKGWLLAPGDYAGNGIYMPEPELPKVEFEESPGHFVEWVNAIKGQGQSMSNFANYAGPLAETVLLGNLAVWTAAGDPKNNEEQVKNGVQGKKIDWDARNLVAKNAPEVAHIIKAEYHNGYKLEG
jgi:predicted dehydrogenase